jgi:hypothetical protein
MEEYRARILDYLFEFLKENRALNKRLQEKFLLNSFDEKESVPINVVKLLYEVANTQSQPNLDNLGPFFKYAYHNEDQLDTAHSFINFLNKYTGIKNPIKGDIECNYHNLFLCLKMIPGWGPKTAALFTKNIWYIHKKQPLIEYKIWNDIPNEIKGNDKLFLPVDRVIQEIFKKIDIKGKAYSFQKINNILQSKYEGDQMEVWDDLWFWGYISQNSKGIIDGNNRNYGFNENKYLMLPESDKSGNTIDEIKVKVNEFIKICGV